MVPDAAKPVPVVVDAPAVEAGSAEAAWQRYRDAHAGATPANAVDTGKVLWSMLTSEAQQLVDEAGKATIAAAGPTGAKLDRTELRFKLLGESAATRVAFMTGATINALTPHATVKDVASAELRIRGGDGRTLVFKLARQPGGPWLLAPSPALLATDQDVFKLPAGREASTGAASLDDLVARWKKANDTGTGWDTYNLMSPAMRARVLRLVASVGGSGAEDAARIWEKTLVDRRNRGLVITGIEIQHQSADGARFEVTYSSGKPESITAVKVDGAWWIEMPL